MTQLTWETASDWDGGQSDDGTVHESVANTDHDDATIVKQGYQIASPYLNSNLTGYWPLHEDSGSTAYDFSGNNNDGTVNGATLGTTGLLGTTAYSFDGSDDNVTTTYQGIASNNGRTVAGWFRSNSATDNVIVSYGDDGTNGSRFTFEGNDAEGPDNVLALGVGSGFVRGSTEIADDSWHHCAVVVPDGVSDVTNCDLYVDASSESFSNTGSQSVSTTQSDVRIGESTNGGRVMNGILSDIRFYDRALSSSEIQTLYDVVQTSGQHTSSVKTS